MEAIADTTGGEAVLSRRFFEDGLKQEVESRDAAYVVASAIPSPEIIGFTGWRSLRRGEVGFRAVRDGALRHFDLSGVAEATEFGGASWLVRSGRIALKPDAYRWSFAIRDEQTGITSYLTFARPLP